VGVRKRLDVYPRRREAALPFTGGGGLSPAQGEYSAARWTRAFDIDARRFSW